APARRACAAPEPGESARTARLGRHGTPRADRTGRLRDAMRRIGMAKSRRWVACAGLAMLGPLVLAAQRDPNSPAAWREQGRTAVAAARALLPGRERARNVVLFIGD